LAQASGTPVFSYLLLSLTFAPAKKPPHLCGNTLHGIQSLAPLQPAGTAPQKKITDRERAFFVDRVPYLGENVI
jgi:hypothetical protein